MSALLKKTSLPPLFGGQRKGCARHGMFSRLNKSRVLNLQFF
jgi:hypothetical protein